MNGQTIQDILVIAGMFFVRIGIPLLIVMGIGYLIQRWLEPQAVQEQFEGIVRSAQERTTAEAGQRSCWEIKNCPPNVRADCAATQQPDIPCWLARQIAGQSLPEGCASCQVRVLANTAQLGASRSA
jgi:hypothetical protein